VGGEAVSASQVRELLRQEDWPAIRLLVPETTYRYLLSEEAAPIIAKLKQSQSRH
jgi:[citrate (pro-3S)-lyase] ligase